MSTGVNQGVRILVERMKTNPEEFYEGYKSKWAQVVERATNAKWLTEEEHKLLNDAANELQRDRFTADVLKALTKGEEEDPYISKEQAKQMFLNPAQVKAAKALGGLSTVTYTGNGVANTIANTLTVGGSPVATQADIDRVLAEKVGAWGSEK